MATMTENCSVCGASFGVVFRYQMEERDGAFSFFCSQRCLDLSQTAGGDGVVVCDACAKRFRVDLVSQVIYVDGKRHYACSLPCRSQILDEARGIRLGDLDQRVESEPDRSRHACRLDVAHGVAQDEPAGIRLVAVASETDQGATGGDHESGKPDPIHAGQLFARFGGFRAGAASESTVFPSERENKRDARSCGPEPAIDGRRRKSPTEVRRIAVFNHKGGTGKTTTSVSLAAGLAQRGHRVLLVDTDAQGNVAVSLNTKTDRSLYHVLVMGLPMHLVRQSVRTNLDVVVSNETLAAAELYLAGRHNRDRVLRDRLWAASEEYDYVVLDCSPSLSLMNQNALVFADSVLVPVACDYLSLVGVRQVLKTVKNVNRLLHHPVRIWGVLPTFFDSRANICREAVETLRQHFGPRCLPPIRSAIKFKEAPAYGQTVFEYASGTHAAEDYLRVVDLIVNGMSTVSFEPKAEAATAG